MGFVSHHLNSPPMGCKTGHQRPLRTPSSTAIRSSTMRSPPVNHGELRVEHVMDNPIVANPHAPGGVFSNELLRSVGPRLSQMFDRIECATTCRAWELSHLPRRGRGELDAVAHGARSVRSSSIITREPSSVALLVGSETRGAQDRTREAFGEEPPNRWGARQMWSGLAARQRRRQGSRSGM